jgi:hypothetical protein
VVPVAVELRGKSQDFRGTEFDAEAATFATVPIDKNLAAELSGFGCCGNVRHLNLAGKAAISDPSGA